MDHRPTPASEVTELLLAWSGGEPAARNQLIEAVYGELRLLARRFLRHERADHSLSPTALVHEAYLKLVDQHRVQWKNRSHFFAIAARLMRRILVDHARAHATLKRDTGLKVPIEHVDLGTDPRDIDLLALDVALDRLTAFDQRQAELVELRFFGGLTVDEAAALLGVSPITVKRDWALARAWLYRELRSNGA